MSRISVSSTVLILTFIGVASAPVALGQVHFRDCATATGHNATVIVPSTFASDFGNESLSAGDEIAVFTPNGLCAGVVTLSGTSTAITVWGNDPMTVESDGFEPGDSLRFVVWDASANKKYSATRPEYAADKTFYQTDGTYKGDAIYSLSSLVKSSLQLGTDNEQPLAFELAANYPNPFNPSTSIRYTVPQDGHVTLDVIDALGRRVQMLVSDVQAAGTYDVRFEGSGFPSGTYLYRLSAGRETQVRRMVLLK